MNSPAFQFYVQDFLTGTMFLTAEEVGAYILLLCHQWDKGGLPATDRELLRIARTKMKVLEVVKQKFLLCEDGMLRNARLEAEREKQIAFREQRRENANKRWKPKEEKTDASASAVHVQTESKSDALQSSSSTSFAFSKTNYVNKKTRIGNQQFEKSPGAMMIELFEQGITELMMNQYRTLRVEDVLAEVELQCPSGTIFTNEQHLLNKFKSVATKMLTSKKDKPAKNRTHDYSRYKRTA
jgi:uncharacterized protein YdaU (DUF1376 family)